MNIVLVLIIILLFIVVIFTVVDKYSSLMSLCQEEKNKNNKDLKKMTSFIKIYATKQFDPQIITNKYFYLSSSNNYK